MKNIKFIGLYFGELEEAIDVYVNDGIIDFNGIFGIVVPDYKVTKKNIKIDTDGERYIKFPGIDRMYSGCSNGIHYDIDDVTPGSYLFGDSDYDPMFFIPEFPDRVVANEDNNFGMLIGTKEGFLKHFDEFLHDIISWYVDDVDKYYDKVLEAIKEELNNIEKEINE